MRHNKRIILYAPTWRDSLDGGKTYSIKPPINGHEGTHTYNINRVFNSSSVAGVLSTGMIGTIVGGSDSSSSPNVTLTNIQNMGTHDFLTVRLGNSVFFTGTHGTMVGYILNSATVTMENTFTGAYFTTYEYSGDGRVGYGSGYSTTLNDTKGYSNLSTSTTLSSLKQSSSYSSWSNFSSNWVLKTVDGISRYPVLKNVDFTYTTIPDITLVVGDQVNLSDYLTPKITAAIKLSSGTPTDSTVISATNVTDSRSKLTTDTIIKALKAGTSKIHITNQYDGYEQYSIYNGLSYTVNYTYKILDSNNLNKQIKIINNKFIENKGFGLFINDCAVEVISNKFSTNRQSGMFLGDIIIDEPKNGLEDFKLEKINLNKKTSFNSKKCFISKNIFCENGANGLHIYGYPYQINVLESIFSSNCQNGILLDLKEEINPNKKIEEFKNSNNINIALNTANVILNKCIIEKNFKNGILLNFGLILCEESFIMNNMDYAIFTKKKEYRNCFKEGKKCEINGSLGGNWGEINLNKHASCGFSCMPNKGGNINLKLKEEIAKNVPSLNDTYTDDNISSVSYKENKCDNKIKKDKDDNCIIV